MKKSLSKHSRVVLYLYQPSESQHYLPFLPAETNILPSLEAIIFDYFNGPEVKKCSDFIPILFPSCVNDVFKTHYPILKKDGELFFPSFVEDEKYPSSNNCSVEFKLSQDNPANFFFQHSLDLINFHHSDLWRFITDYASLEQKLPELANASAFPRMLSQMILNYLNYISHYASIRSGNPPKMNFLWSYSKEFQDLTRRLMEENQYQSLHQQGFVEKILSSFLSIIGRLPMPIQNIIIEYAREDVQTFKPWLQETILTELKQFLDTREVRWAQDNTLSESGQCTVNFTREYLANLAAEEISEGLGNRPGFFTRDLERKTVVTMQARISANPFNQKYCTLISADTAFDYLTKVFCSNMFFGFNSTPVNFFVNIVSYLKDFNLEEMEKIYLIFNRVKSLIESHLLLSTKFLEPTTAFYLPLRVVNSLYEYSIRIGLSIANWKTLDGGKPTLIWLSLLLELLKEKVKYLGHIQGTRRVVIPATHQVGIRLFNYHCREKILGQILDHKEKYKKCTGSQQGSAEQLQNCQDLTDKILNTPSSTLDIYRLIGELGCTLEKATNKKYKGLLMAIIDELAAEQPQSSLTCGR